MKRRFVLLLAVSLVIVVVAVPCLAADIDYNDFVYNIDSDGESDIVSVSIPVSTFTRIEWRLWDRTDGEWPLLASGTGSSYSYAFNSSKIYSVTCNPFSGDYLVLEDIPDGTVITFSYDINGAAYAGDSGIRARISVTYFDDNYNSLGYFNGTFVSGQYLEMNEVSYTVAKPAGAKYMIAAMTFDDFVPLGSNTYTLTLDAVTFQFSISSMLRLQQETGRTNKLLESIQDQLDEITDREPEPIEPTWGESAGDAEEKEDQIIDQLDPDQVTNDLADMHLTLVDNLLLYTNAFAAISAIWILITDLPFIKIILYCSLLFGLLAAFLGMGLAAGRASDRHSGRSSGKKGK